LDAALLQKRNDQGCSRRDRSPSTAPSFIHGLPSKDLRLARRLRFCMLVL